VPRAGDLVDLREYFERVLSERHQYYETKFRDAEVAVSAALVAQQTATAAALAAQEKATQSAFVASEKAIDKSEQAQTAYNAKSNEFRGQLDDQAKTFMARSEVNSLVKGLEIQLSTLRDSQASEITRLREDIASLRESRSALGGRDEAARSDRTQGNWLIGTAVTIGIAIVGAIVAAIAALIGWYVKTTGFTGH
jgi:chromosome segregation ATPase